ncbi:MAG: 50S ribosomal protein L1 [Candidatus Nanoarchaeia archaeon]|nr:50S ribosomal protein L1 [Candidatus Nanoarchaeia archaeon]MDD5239180.1 50S ribosomal protein L1 [Candidatus Nanoarchaeia archaeon]
MENTKILEALKKARESKKRNFAQSIDFSILLKEFDLKNPENKVDEFFTLPVNNGKKIKICGLVDKDLSTQSSEVFDRTVVKQEFPEWLNKKKEIKSLARDCDYFVAQSNIMTDIATVFGKILGPKGKMPSPKAGCIVPPKVDLKIIRHKLDNTVHIQTKKQPVVSVRIGNEKFSDEDLAKNINAVYALIVSKLPRGEQQIRKVYIKTTMGEPVYFK